MVIDGAATIGLSVSCCLTDAVEGEEKGTVDDTGGVGCEHSETGLVEDVPLAMLHFEKLVYFSQKHFEKFVYFRLKHFEKQTFFYNFALAITKHFEEATI